MRGTPARRWLAQPSQPAGACKHCARATVRLVGLRPLARPKDVGDVAGFQICTRCDSLLLTPAAA